MPVQSMSPLLANCGDETNQFELAATVVGQVTFSLIPGGFSGVPSTQPKSTLSSVNLKTFGGSTGGWESPGFGASESPGFGASESPGFGASESPGWGAV